MATKAEKARKRVVIPLLITEKFKPTWEKFLEIQPASMSRNAWICYAIEKVVTDSKLNRK